MQMVNDRGIPWSSCQLVPASSQMKHIVHHLYQTIYCVLVCHGRKIFDLCQHGAEEDSKDGRRNSSRIYIYIKLYNYIYIIIIPSLTPNFLETMVHYWILSILGRKDPLCVFHIDVFFFFVGAIDKS